jgi:hypothetical protein
MTSPITRFLADRISDAETGWSIGSFGAIAEFVRDPDEPVELARNDRSLVAVTTRGGIRVAPPAETRPFASETAVGAGWNHRVALCLPSERCAMGRRAALTELGTDDQALRDQDKAEILFDLGLDCLQIDACVRTRDPDLLTQLRNAIGRSLFEPGNPAIAAILVANPHRVFLSRIGRIEVFQPIPAADGKSPQGPHTHVLPKLLAHKRTHAATEPTPDGFVPCAHIYPPHPAKDANGRARPFDTRHHDAFQALLREFGDPGLVMLKQRVAAAVAAGGSPSSVVVSDDRFARAAVRIALRQLHALDPSSSRLDGWMALGGAADEAQSEAEQH